MPDPFFDTVAYHLPREQPVGPEGGRPGIAHRVVMRVIWFVLATGARWEEVSPELGGSGSERRPESGTDCTPTCLRLLRTSQASHHRLGQTGGNKASGAAWRVESRPRNRNGGRRLHGQRHLLSRGSPLSSGEGA